LRELRSTAISVFDNHEERGSVSAHVAERKQRIAASVEQASFAYHQKKSPDRRPSFFQSMSIRVHQWFVCFRPDSSLRLHGRDDHAPLFPALAAQGRAMLRQRPFLLRAPCASARTPLCPGSFTLSGGHENRMENRFEGVSFFV